MPRCCFKQLCYNPLDKKDSDLMLNSLAVYQADGWAIVSVMPVRDRMVVLLKGTVEGGEEVMPLERSIKDARGLYRCPERMKHYPWGKLFERVEFISIEDAEEGNFYTDDGVYEMYLSDGFYFLGTEISNYKQGSYVEFAEKNKHLFRGDDLKIMFIDYPEDK